MMNFTCKKHCKKDTKHTEQASEEAEFFLEKNYSECWDLVAKPDYAILSREMKYGHPSSGSKTSEPITYGWMKMPRDQQIF